MNPKPSFEEQRAQMVEHYLIHGHPPITDRRILDVMGDIPRHLFIESAFQSCAYENHPQPIGHGQTISQPYIIAYMTQWLAPQPGQRILEIGTGCGYQTAILAQLGGQVLTIEIDETLQAHARNRLEALGIRNIEYFTGDGFRGIPGRSPFDRIIATCARDEPPASLLDQLCDGGRAIIPVGPKDDQALLGWTCRSGRRDCRRLLPVGFVTNRAAKR